MEATWDELRRAGAVDALEDPPWEVEVVTRLTGHASTRRFYRLEGPDPDGDETAILVVYPEGDEAGLRRHVETTEWFRAAAVPVPKILGRGRRAVLLADAGRRTVADVAPGSLRRRAYRQALDALVRIQRHGRRVGGPNPGWALDRRRLREELDFTERHAVAGWLGHHGGDRIRLREFDWLATRVAKLPTAICHRDFHARNLMIRDGRVTVVDFQDAMEGPILYDLASLVWDNYCDVPEEVEGSVLASFRRHRRLRRLRSFADLPLPPIPRGLPPGGRQAFCLVALQRHLKALGTFGYQVHRLGRQRYSRWAPRTWRHARRCAEALGRVELLEALRPFDRLL